MLCNTKKYKNQSKQACCKTALYCWIKTESRWNKKLISLSSPDWSASLRPSLERTVRPDALMWPSSNWLAECIDDGQAIPLVPFTEEQEDAMDCASFQDLMRHCGLHPPSTEQVTQLMILFWRCLCIICNRVYITVGHPSVSLFRRSTTATSTNGFAAECTAGRRYLSIAADALPALCCRRRRSARYAGSVTLTADVGGWTQTCLTTLCVD